MRDDGSFEYGLLFAQLDQRLYHELTMDNIPEGKTCMAGSDRSLRCVLVAAASSDSQVCGTCHLTQGRCAERSEGKTTAQQAPRPARQLPKSNMRVTSFQHSCNEQIILGTYPSKAKKIIHNTRFIAGA